VTKAPEHPSFEAAEGGLNVSVVENINVFTRWWNRRSSFVVTMTDIKGGCTTIYSYYNQRSGNHRPPPCDALVLLICSVEVETNPSLKGTKISI
jgi:hypothetical protein